jgi:hypothetical protein
VLKRPSFLEDEQWGPGSPLTGINSVHFLQPLSLLLIRACI